MGRILFLFLAILPFFIFGIFAQDCGHGKRKVMGVGVEPSARGDWPWLVALFYTEYDRFFCAGSLISAMHVLSAAHCFQGKMRSEILPPHQVKALLGKFNLTVGNETDSKSHFVSEIAIHPDWNFAHDKFDADIAILVLAEAAGFNSLIRTVCLPSKIDGDASGTGTVVGWSAKTSNNDMKPTPTPFELQQPVVDAGTCYPTVFKLSRYSSARMFCGGFLNQSTSTCSGDSGGGFYFFDGWVWTIRGIACGGLRSLRGCDLNAYSLYTNVAKFRDWISEKIDKTMGWMKVEFQCTKEDILTECQYTYDGTVTSNLKFSAKLISSNPSDALDVVKQVLIDFSPSDHVFPGIGDEFSNLKKLYIYGESIKYVVRYDFANMSQLTNLYLLELSIQFLQEDLLSDLPNLEHIVVSFCKIERIPEKSFSNQRKLKWLDLSSNKLKVLDKDLFKFNLGLVYIDLRNNNLQKIFVDFTRLSALTGVDLLGNACLKRYWSKEEMTSLEAYQQDIRTCCREIQPETDPKCLILSSFLPSKPRYVDSF